MKKKDFRLAKGESVLKSRQEGEGYAASGHNEKILGFNTKDTFWGEKD